MKYLKNISLSIGIIILSILLITFFFSVLYYFKIINNSFLSIVKIIIPILSLILGGIIMGKKSDQKGWLEGLKLGLCFLIILTLFNYLGLNMKMELKFFLYDIILLISCILGSMIGINLSPNKNT